MILIKTDNMRKETLEEASINWFMKKGFNIYNHYDTRSAFVDGAKWQQEQYSNEEKHIGHTINEFDKTYIEGFNNGAKWQQEQIDKEIQDLKNRLYIINESTAKVIKLVENLERSYSEEDLEEAFKSGFTNCYNNNNLTFGEWFEQFKNK